MDWDKLSSVRVVSTLTHASEEWPKGTPCQLLCGLIYRLCFRDLEEMCHRQRDRNDLISGVSGRIGLASHPHDFPTVTPIYCSGSSIRAYGRRRPNSN